MQQEVIRRGALACIRVLCSGMEVPEGSTKLAHKRAGIRMNHQPGTRPLLLCHLVGSPPTSALAWSETALIREVEEQGRVLISAGLDNLVSKIRM